MITLSTIHTKPSPDIEYNRPDPNYIAYREITYFNAVANVKMTVTPIDATSRMIVTTFPDEVTYNTYISDPHVIRALIARDIHNAKFGIITDTTITTS